jgi:glutamine synthetase
MDDIYDNDIYEYIWLDANKKLRSKVRVCTKELVDSEPWSYDGSSTGQATTENSEVLLYPKKVYNNPFRESGYLVLCSTSFYNDSRNLTEEVFDKTKQLKPMFGFEQEFFVIDAEKYQVIGLNKIKHHKEKQFDYYCGVGADNVYFRKFMDDVLNHCIFAGINVNGYNFEVAVGQAEFQITGIGIDACDQLTLLRYILERTGEDYNFIIKYDCKLLGEEWNGSGLHTNFSTEYMRKHPTDKSYTINLIEKLGQKHNEAMLVYGENNHLRLTGIHETSSYHKFTYGIGDRSASVRIPVARNQNYDKTVFNAKYFEDRRPASNADPYLVASFILMTTLS